MFHVKHPIRTLPSYSISEWSSAGGNASIVDVMTSFWKRRLQLSQLVIETSPRKSFFSAPALCRLFQFLLHGCHDASPGFLDDFIQDGLELILESGYVLIEYGGHTGVAQWT